MDETQIYELPLHGEYNKSVSITQAVRVLRVPGGWIYTQFYAKTALQTSVFVPFTQELNKKKPWWKFWQ